MSALLTCGIVGYGKRVTDSPSLAVALVETLARKKVATFTLVPVSKTIAERILIFPVCHLPTPTDALRVARRIIVTPSIRLVSGVLAAPWPYSLLAKELFFERMDLE
ncbi:MAG: hypothetical protein IJU76_03725 [Desulfovibrionaceae bacterium]|nr:hypothetical protein [Desulfovibrionaceae bacterium]